MFLYHLIILSLAWGFYIASKEIFPKPLASISAANDWGTMLLFKPLHLLLSFLCFLSALLLIRWITITCGKLLFGKGGIWKVNRVVGLTYLTLGMWLLGMVYVQHPFPTAVIAGGIVIYDLFHYITRMRKKKRLQNVLQQLQK